MNLTVQDIGPCKKLLTFEIEAEAVTQAFEEVEHEFQKEARLPGFRPGKAPREMVLRRFGREIEEEAKQKLIREHYQSGLKEKNLAVVRVLNVEEGACVKGQAMQFVVTVETEPQFELPEYRGLPAKREARTVTEDDIARALEALREQRVQFVTVDRPAAQGDMVVVNYVGFCDGRPIGELAPASRGLAQHKDFWIEIRPGSFLPGFAEQLVGAKAGDKRSVEVEFPAHFPVAPLAGKKAVYQVEVVEVKQRQLPPLDEEFARSWGADNMEKLREGVRADLQNELNQKTKRSIRNQLIRALLDRVSFELPESLVQEETRAVVYDIVSDSQERGVSKETLERQKDEIYALASRSARDRVKLAFLFNKIAEREGIRIDPDAVNARLVVLASAAKKPVQQFVQELKERGGLQRVAEQMLHEKVLDFLHENARIEDVPPGSLRETET